MKFLNLILFILIALPAYAQQVPPVVRNDNAATTIQGTNGGTSKIGTNSKGVVWMQGITGGTPIPVAPEVKGTPANNYGTLAFGSVTTAGFATLVTNAASGRILQVTNKLDVDVVLSTDATNNGPTVAASSVAYIDYKEAGLVVTSNISVKALGSNATSGSIYGTVIY